MATYDFDFQRYVDRNNARQGVAVDGERPEFGDYAFSGDLRVLRRLNKMKPVHIVAEATVRFWKSVQRNELLGQAVKVTRRQFPEIHDATVDCAHALDIPVPTVYVSRTLGLNAGTYGTNEEAFIIIGSALVKLLEPDELKFVIGHECGHLHNNHVVYRTAVTFLTQGIGAYVKWAIVPATIALKSWSRRGEITCDRAGLVCSPKEEAAVGAMLKLATGSKELADKVDVEDYLKQIDGIKEGVGRFAELMSSHPYLPKRIQAMRLFTQSNYYRSLIGERGGKPLDEVDREVEELIKVM